MGISDAIFSFIIAFRGLKCIERSQETIYMDTQNKKSCKGTKVLTINNMNNRLVQLKYWG